MSSPSTQEGRYPQPAPGEEDGTMRENGHPRAGSTEAPETSAPANAPDAGQEVSGGAFPAEQTAGAETPQETPDAGQESAPGDVARPETSARAPEEDDEELPLPAAGSAAAPLPAEGGGGDNPPPAVTHAQHAGEPAPPPNEEPMTLIGHLNELRRRLTRIVIMVLLGFIACYGISEPLYGWLSEPLKAALPEGSKLIYTSPQGAFFVYLKVALVASIFLTSPFSFYQIWAFIAPGLYKEEKQAVMPLAFFSAFFFLAGASFCYYLVFPLAFRFFMGFATDVIVPMISVEEYLSFALKLLIAFGLVFEMPLFAYFLAKLGLLTADMMRRQRKYAILAIFIVAAILTPPDVFSQCLMAMPMLLLYEVSIRVAASAGKKKNAAKAGTEPEKDEAHGDA